MRPGFYFRGKSRSYKAFPGTKTTTWDGLTRLPFMASSPRATRPCQGAATCTNEPVPYAHTRRSAAEMNTA